MKEDGLLRLNFLMKKILNPFSMRMLTANSAKMRWSKAPLPGL